MYKFVHYLAKQFNALLVSTGRESLRKGTSGQTLVSSLLPYYYVELIVNLV